jgi:putative effector of murein hydrolase LrgA (UPF0299 family)
MPQQAPPAESVAARERRVGVACLAALTLYTAVRLLALPADAAIAGCFSHDGAYLCIVAEQLKAGRGYVNPAHWLLFLNPPSLPVPYHNANPLYPTLIAGISALSGLDTPRAGMALSMVANSLLMLSLYAVLRRLGSPAWVSFLCAAAAGVYPANWAESLSVVPDALCTALVWACVAVVVGARKGRHWLVAGGLFGLAWLTRSTAALAIPGLIWWLWRRRPHGEMARGGALFFLAAGLVVSPWLFHTALVWGSPFRSDAYYYWIQDYAARPLGGQVERYWYGFAPPPSLGQILAGDLGGFVSHTLRGIPVFIYLLAAGLSGWSKPALAILALLFVPAVLRIGRDWRTPEFQAGALTIALTAAGLVVRAASTEIRYFGVATCLLLLWALLSIGSTPSLRLKRAATILSSVYLLCFLIPQDALLWKTKIGVSEDLRAFRDVAVRVAQRLPGEPMITHKPYLYTFYTGVPAVSPPWAPKTAVLAFMERYRVRYILLPTAALAHYLRGGGTGLAPEIHTREAIASFTLLEREPPD